MNKDDMMQVVEILNKSNYFQNQLKEYLIKFDKPSFDQASEDYKSFLSKPEHNLTQSEISLKRLKQVSEALCDFLRSNKFKENKCLEYYDVVSELASPNIFTFILWTQDKKHGCIEMFNNYEIDLSAQEYDSLTLVLLPHLGKENVPYDIDRRLEYLSKQKKEYFSYQNKYKLVEELTSLPFNPKEPKKTKI